MHQWLRNFWVATATATAALVAFLALPLFAAPVLKTAPIVDFEFHKKVPPSRLKVELASAANVSKTEHGLVQTLTITNSCGKEIEAHLAHEWHGGEWPLTALYASVSPADDKKVQPFAPVYLAGEDQRAARRVGLATGKSLDVKVRMDWPGTGSVPANPLIHKPGRYNVRFALVFEVNGKPQYVTSAPVVVECKALDQRKKQR
jgi:hypothetical protein